MKPSLGLSLLSSLTLTAAAATHGLQHLHGNLHARHEQIEERATAYWLQDIKHQGIAAFNANPGTYKVFRNVKDYGAVGDGIHDDTAAINLAISSGGRCAPGACASSTTTPAVVYIPAGTYNITSSIIDYYYTQIIGNPNALPVLKADKSFPVATTFGVIDGDQYGANGLGFGSTNTFYRQIRNLIIDTTAIPETSPATGIHWPTAQATSIQNCIFKMNDKAGSLHRGIFIEEGSGGFLNDLSFYGGVSGGIFGNQQFTMRNLNFFNHQGPAIQQLWDWGWTYKSINIKNCSVGIDMTALNGTGAQTVGSVTFIDSSITDTGVGIATSYSSTSSPATGGSLILENVKLQNVPVAVQGLNKATVLAGGTKTITGWGEGHKYTPHGPTKFQGAIAAFPRPGSLTTPTMGKFYERSKPQYAGVPVSGFVSARSSGAKGDGKTDDTAALNNLFASAAKAGKIVFVDAGDYLVTAAIIIPPGSKIVGETYSVILASGKYFSDINSPKAVVKVGAAGQTGLVEWSDMIVSTQGPTAGAILIEWNLSSPSAGPSGMWDVHTRIGGFAGSKLQLAQCPKTPTKSNFVNPNCIAAFMSMHIGKSAAGLYLENVWLWTADHDIEAPGLNQTTIFTGRGMYIESTAGNIWLVGTAVEHHQLYQYQFTGTKNIFAGQIQTETAYYQPNPIATVPYPFRSVWNDPDFATYCKGKKGTCGSGWGLRILNSDSILVYGAGLYSFFSNYSTTCSNAGNGETCQTQIFAVDTGLGAGLDKPSQGRGESGVYVYNLNTIGSVSMIDRDGASLAKFSDNINNFPDTIALFRPS